MMNPNTKRSQELRAKRKADGLVELRGIWVEPQWHAMLKDKCQSLVRGWRRHANR